MEIGLEHQLNKKVTETVTARAVGSGGLDVLATPAMVSWMEEAAYKAVEPYLETGQSTVGTKVDILHLAATAIGRDIVVKARLTGIEKEGRKLLFEIEAYEGETKIGGGCHERAVINIEKFMARIEPKKAL